tara:strand:+ start:14007 stop:15350 length:1344 start_codon:yes stop_codon:yes gene_type:complete
MGGRSDPQTTTTTSSNEPSQFIQPHLTDLFSRANQAMDRTNNGPFGGDLYAGPTDAQLMGQNMGIDAALGSNPAAGTRQAEGTLSNRLASGIPSQGMGAFSMSAAPQTERLGPQGAAQFQQTGLNQATNLGGAGAVSQGIDQVAGASPNVQGGNLQAAISAGIDPIQRRLEQDIMPEFRNSLVGSGAFDNSRAGFTGDRIVEENFTRPANEVAQGLIYQDYAQRLQNEQANYQQRTDIGANAVENFSDRTAQDQNALRGQQLQQGLAGNQFGLQDLQQRQNLAANDVNAGNQYANQQFSLTNQLGQQDLGQQRTENGQLLNQELQTALALPQLGASGFQLGMQPANALSQIGQEQQGFNQGFLNEALQQFQMQNQQPFQNLDAYSNIIQGQPFINQSQSQTTPGPQQGGLGQGIQGGIGGAATGFTFGGPVGAAVGGGLGLLGGLFG